MFLGINYQCHDSIHLMQSKTDGHIRSMTLICHSPYFFENHYGHCYWSKSIILFLAKYPPHVLRTQKWIFILCFRLLSVTCQIKHVQWWGQISGKNCFIKYIRVRISCRRLRIFYYHGALSILIYCVFHCYDLLNQHFRFTTKGTRVLLDVTCAQL